MEAISIVILSGGRSSRMGRDKANLMIEDKTFVERICESLGQADEILFSVRNQEDFPQVKLLHITDLYPGCGPMAGIHSALTHARNDWVFVVACDTPFVTWDTLQTLLGHRQQGCQAIVPLEEDGRLHATCGLYHKSMLPILQEELRAGNYRLMKILKSCSLVMVPTHCFKDYQRVFSNVNTAEDYRKFQNNQGGVL